MMVCRNPLLAEDRAREELRAAIGRLLEPIALATRRPGRRPQHHHSRGAAESGERAQDDRPSARAPAAVSDSARARAAGKRTGDGTPVHSFQTLPADLGTITRKTVAPYHRECTSLPDGHTADTPAGTGLRLARDSAQTGPIGSNGAGKTPSKKVRYVQDR